MNHDLHSRTCSDVWALIGILAVKRSLVSALNAFCTPLLGSSVLGVRSQVHSGKQRNRGVGPEYVYPSWKFGLGDQGEQGTMTKEGRKGLAEVKARTSDRYTGSGWHTCQEPWSSETVLLGWGWDSACGVTLVSGLCRTSPPPSPTPGTALFLHVGTAFGAATAAQAAGNKGKWRGAAFDVRRAAWETIHGWDPGYMRQGRVREGRQGRVWEGRQGGVWEGRQGGFGRGGRAGLGGAAGRGEKGRKGQQRRVSKILGAGSGAAPAGPRR